MAHQNSPQPSSHRVIIASVWESKVAILDQPIRNICEEVRRNHQDLQWQLHDLFLHFPPTSVEYWVELMDISHEIFRRTVAKQRSLEVISKSDSSKENVIQPDCKNEEMVMGEKNSSSDFVDSNTVEFDLVNSNMVESKKIESELDESIKIKSDLVKSPMIKPNLGESGVFDSIESIIGESDFIECNFIESGILKMAIDVEDLVEDNVSMMHNEGIIDPIVVVESGFRQSLCTNFSSFTDSRKGNLFGCNGSANSRIECEGILFTLCVEVERLDTLVITIIGAKLYMYFEDRVVRNWLLIFVWDPGGVLISFLYARLRTS